MLAARPDRTRILSSELRNGCKRTPMQSNGVPSSIQEYKKWLVRNFGYREPDQKRDYGTIAALLYREFVSSTVWEASCSSLRAAHDKYKIRTGVDLFVPLEERPQVVEKPFDSFI